MDGDTVFRSRHVMTPAGELDRCVVVRDGVIVAIEPYDFDSGGMNAIDVGDAALLPGLVDTHVHLNDPGRTEWEGFDSGTRAAAAGGITTVVDMPLNSVPATTSMAGLEAKRAAAAGRCHVDVGFWGGVVPGNTPELSALWDAGVLGFKCFLTPSGVAEFDHVHDTDLRRALPVLAELGAPLLVHAELPQHLVEPAAGSDPRAYATWLNTRPDTAEVAAVKLLIDLCRETGARIHVVHVTSGAVLPLLRTARAEGLPITAETCPHYLHFSAESIADGRTEWKCAPPIRSSENREQLWRGLVDGDLDLVASDHSPAPPTMKQPGDGSFLDAWGGIASLQLGLPVVWTGARSRGIPLQAVVQWMSNAPARLAGLAHKGAIETGRDADFVVFDPDAEWTVDAAALHHRHPLTPYQGEGLSGIVRATYLRGAPAYREARGAGRGQGGSQGHGAAGEHGPAHGRLLERQTTGMSWTSHS